MSEKEETETETDRQIHGKRKADRPKRIEKGFKKSETRRSNLFVIQEIKK